MVRRLAAASAAFLLAAGLSLGFAGAASAQPPPVQVELVCGPLTSNIVTTVTDGAANTTGTVSVDIAGINLSIPIDINAQGVGTATLPVLTTVLDLVSQLQVVVATAGGTVNTPLANVCGII